MVDVGAVQAPGVHNLKAARSAAEFDVPARDSDVVEEDVGVRVAARRGDVGVQQEPRTGVGAAVRDEQGRSEGKGLNRCPFLS